MIGLKPSDISDREVERRKLGLEVLCRMAYIIAKADMPISKFSVLRNIVQQSQLTMLGDSHEHVRAITNRLNDFFTVVETQLRGLKALVDSNLHKKNERQPKLSMVYRSAVGNLSWSVMTNAIKDMEYTIKKQFCVIRKDIVDSITELLRDATHTSQRLATQGTPYGFTHQALRRVYEAVREQTLSEMRAALGWSFMLDESTDLTVIKQLLITVKYYHIDTKATRIRVLDIIPIPNGKARTMLQVVLTLFRNCELDLDYCYGIGADGASVNQGAKGGFIRLFLENLQPGLQWIPHMWCSSHLTALGSSAGNLHCKLAQLFEEDMQNINADFTRSPVRTASLAGYQHMLAATEEKFLTITPWHECRWLSRDSSTKTLAQSLRALLFFYNNRAFGKDAMGKWMEED